jgi:hypothetical protein
VWRVRFTGREVCVDGDGAASRTEHRKSFGTVTSGAQGPHRVSMLGWLGQTEVRRARPTAAAGQPLAGAFAGRSMKSAPRPIRS